MGAERALRGMKWGGRERQGYRVSRVGGEGSQTGLGMGRGGGGEGGGGLSVKIWGFNEGGKRSSNRVGGSGKVGI